MEKFRHNLILSRKKARKKYLSQNPPKKTSSCNVSHDCSLKLCGSSNTSNKSNMSNSVSQNQVNNTHSSFPQNRDNSSQKIHSIQRTSISQNSIVQSEGNLGNPIHISQIDKLRMIQNQGTIGQLLAKKNSPNSDKMIKSKNQNNQYSQQQHPEPSQTMNITINKTSQQQNLESSHIMNNTFNKTTQKPHLESSHVMNNTFNKTTQKPHLESSNVMNNQIKKISQNDRTNSSSENQRNLINNSNPKMISKKKISLNEILKVETNDFIEIHKDNKSIEQKKNIQPGQSSLNMR